MTTAQPGVPAATRRAAYLEEIAAGLRGPRRRRQRILAELGEGLDDAIADHAHAGRPPEAAVAAAIDQFGSPHAIAEAFAGELGTAYARRTLAWFIATGPVVGIWWLVLLHPHPWRDGLIALLAAIPVIPLIGVAVVAAAGTVATTGRLMRWLPEATPRRALAATLAVAGLALVGDAVVIGVYLHSDLPTQPLAVLAVGASTTRIVCSLITLHHAAQRRRTVTAASAYHAQPTRTRDARR